MTQPCDLCSTPSETPTCSRCLGYQAWAGNDTTSASPARLLKTRSNLESLPHLVAALARCLTEKPADTGGGSSGKPASKPPMRLDVVHLVDEREKPLWWGEDPRAADLQDRYGVTWSLHAWSRIVWEEQPEAAFLAEAPTTETEAAYLLDAWPWIGQQPWSDEFCDDVNALARKCRAGLGIRPELRLSCRYCRDVVQPVDAKHDVTTWEACAYGLCRGCGRDYPLGPALAALGQVQDPMTLKSIAEATSLPERTLRRWCDVGAIKPAPDSAGRRRGRLFDLAEVRATARTLNRSLAG